MEKLIEYFINETNKTRDELKSEIRLIQERLNDLQKFKVEMIVSARWVSLIVSAVCGLLTMIVSAVITLKLK